MNQETENRIESPCVRNCCLDDNDICMGCFRTVDEIRQWASANDKHRQMILDLSATRRKSNKAKY